MTTTLHINGARPAHSDNSGEIVPSDITPRVRRGISCVQLNNGLWRITRDTGHVLGYVERLTGARGPVEQHASRDQGAAEGEGGDQPRYQAKRLSSTGRSFLSAGEFWSFDDAVDCLRFS